MTSPFRTLLSAVLAALLATLGSGCAAPSAAHDPAFALSARQLSAKVWYFEGESGVADRRNHGFTSNAGFVVTSDGVVVFDALGTPTLAEAMLRAIRDVTRQPIRRVVVSHYHADHFYGLQVFKREGAEIWARSEAQVYLRSPEAGERLVQRRQTLAPWVNEHTRLLGADHWLALDASTTEAFSLGDTRFVLISGGNAHSPSDLMLAIPDQGVLFAGDLFFSGRLPFVADGNTRAWLAALTRIEQLAPRIVVPGHGAASTDVAADLRATRRYIEFLRATMARAVAELEDFEPVYAATDWSAFKDEPTFDAANRRNAYSVYLEMQAELLNRGSP